MGALVWFSFVFHQKENQVKTVVLHYAFFFFFVILESLEGLK